MKWEDATIWDNPRSYLRKMIKWEEKTGKSIKKSIYSEWLKKIKYPSKKRRTK